jgi:hypothetical protein
MTDPSRHRILLKEPVRGARLLQTCSCSVLWSRIVHRQPVKNLVLFDIVGYMDKLFGISDAKFLCVLNSSQRSRIIKRVGRSNNSA